MRVLEISVKPEVRRISMVVDTEGPDCFLTSQMPHITRGLFRLIPRLASHTCHNGKGKSFRQECRNTEIPHLFEHLIIELQLMAQQNADDHLRGETEWNWQQDPYGRFHVTVEYQDEMLAIGSIRLAERILAALDRRDVSLDIHAEVERLRLMYVLGREMAGAEPPRWATVAARTWSSVHPPVAAPAPIAPVLPSLFTDPHPIPVA
ncbi:MAG: hypothetical protein SFU56_09900 [Capsulimonadales bacterium]|nr:hypothetical protein [Capsulimonadales bacterium]